MGKPKPSPERLKTSFYCPRDLVRRLKVRAAEDESTLRDVLVAAAEHYLATTKPKHGGMR